LGNLQELNLSNNKINVVTNNMFNSLVNLEVLNLSNNRIKIIVNSMFSSLVNLEILNLSNNQILIIAKNSWDGLGKLKLLNLSYNKMEIILTDTFISLINLKSLYLSNNELLIIAKGSFNGLNNLKCLNLSNNQIMNITKNMFSGLNNLKRLYLSNNQILNILKSTFSLLVNLKKLYLFNNQIFKIEENVFNGLCNLQEINLSNNQIANIPNNLFFQLVNLKKLNLFNNHLSSIKKIKYIFEQSDRLGELNEFNNCWKLCEGLGDFLSRIREIYDIKKGTDEQKKVVYNNLANILINMDKDSLFMNDCINIANSCLNNCGDAIHFGYLRILMTYNIFDKNTLYNSLPNIFKRVRYQNTFDYIINVVQCIIEQMNKSKAEGLEFHLFILLNSQIAKLLKLPINSGMLYEDFVRTIFYENNQIKLDKSIDEIVGMTLEYFNNIDNFYEAMLDNEFIKQKYKDIINQIETKYPDELFESFDPNNQEHKKYLLMMKKDKIDFLKEKFVIDFKI
jgi:uncharacterized protein YktA (UPF0223 family)